jgi:hypothetical protein
VNPLDLRQNGAVGEDFSDFRQPLWIAKALYNLGTVANFWNEAGIEAFFSPNSRPQGYQTNVLIGETWKIHVDQSVIDQGQNAPGFSRPMAAPFRQIRHTGTRRRWFNSAERKRAAAAPAASRTSCTGSRTTYPRPSFRWTT